MLDVSLSTGMLTNQILFERKICCRDVNSLTINDNFLIDHSEQNNIYRTFRIIDDTGDKLLLKVSLLDFSENVDLFRLFPLRVRYAPPVTVHVPLHSKSLQKNMARASGVANILGSFPFVPPPSLVGAYYLHTLTHVPCFYIIIYYVFLKHVNYSEYNAKVRYLIALKC